MAAGEVGGSSAVAGVTTSAGDERLSPIRCYNYRTQLAVAGQQVSDNLAAGRAPALLLGDNVEAALETLETLGFAFRQALIERRLDVFGYRGGARDRVFFRRDYERLLDEALNRPDEGSGPVIVTGFDALFDATERAAIDNQIVDLLQAIDERNVSVCGLYVPASWSQDDALGKCLSAALGEGGLRYAASGEEGGGVTLRTVRANANPDDDLPDTNGVAA